MMPKPASKLVIAVDVDEVLFPMASTFLDYYNQEHNTGYKFDEMASYYLEDITGDSREYMLSKIRAYLGGEHYEKGQPITGAIDAIHKLREKYRLVVVTARDHFFRGHTEEFLETHFKGLYDELYYTHAPDKIDVKVPKSKICHEINAIALIDDSLSNVIECAQNGIECVLFGEYPWNKADELPQGAIRVKDWQGVLEYFNEKG